MSVGIQPGATVSEFLVDTSNVWQGGITQAIEAFLKFLRHASPRQFRAMAIKAEVAEVRSLEPIQDDIQRRALLGDEEDRLSARNQLCDQIGNSLTLARTRRTTDDAILPTKGCLNRPVLR